MVEYDAFSAIAKFPTRGQLHAIDKDTEAIVALMDFDLGPKAPELDQHPS